MSWLPERLGVVLDANVLLRHLDDQALAELDARQQAVLDNCPSFDPGELERARQRLDATRATGVPRPPEATVHVTFADFRRWRG